MLKFTRKMLMDVKVLKSDFFERKVLDVAPDLLGKCLVRRKGVGETRTIITEVEAYDGEEDKACHASGGMSPRNEVMYGPAGVWYVYLVYGMHNMLNIVTDGIGYPSAVLIRGTSEVTGPGRLSNFLSIDRSFNGRPALEETGLWIEEGVLNVDPVDIKRTERIGVQYAGEWVGKPYRFLWTL